MSNEFIAWWTAFLSSEPNLRIDSSWIQDRNREIAWEAWKAALEKQKRKRDERMKNVRRDFAGDGAQEVTKIGGKI